MTESKKAELEGKFSLLTEELEEFRSELDRLNNQKEEAYKKKKEVSVKIVERIKFLTGSKKQRNEYTDSVKTIKQKRDSLNREISRSIEEIKKLKAAHQKSLENKPQVKNPQGILKKIEEMKYALETTPMEFSKEQKFTKQIKELEKQAAGFKESSDLWKQIKKGSKHIDKLKKEANAHHKEIQDVAGKSQEHHKEIIGKSDEIDGLRKEEEEANQAFVKKKEEYQALNSELKAKQDELRELRKSLGLDKASRKKKKEDEEKLTLKERETRVQEKLQKGEKLTTEDLLVMQRMDPHEDDVDLENELKKKK